MNRFAINGGAINAATHYRDASLSSSCDWTWFGNVSANIFMTSSDDWTFTSNANITKLTATASHCDWEMTNEATMVTVVTMASALSIGWGSVAVLARFKGLASACSIDFACASAMTRKRLLVSDADWTWTDTGTMRQAAVQMASDCEWSWTGAASVAGQGYLYSALSVTWTGVANVENNPFNDDPPSRTFYRPFRQREFFR